MSMRDRKRTRIERLNLIPILDAVFIFIFFLLMSAQFVEIREIQTDVPAQAEINDNVKKKDPLLLNLKITKDEIVIRSGLKQKVLDKIKLNKDEFDKKKLHSLIYKLKTKNPSESTVILTPLKNVPYKYVIAVMDQIREIHPQEKVIAFKNKKGETIRTSKLFSDISFGEAIN